jgi:hypothetical protein
LKEYKNYADQDIVLWLNSNAEVSQSALKIRLCSCLLPTADALTSQGYC